MKKILIILLSLMLLITVVGCGSEEGKGKTDVNLNEDKPEKKEPEEDKDSKVEESKIPIEANQVKPEITLLDPDSIGNVYMQSTFTNNTKYPIIGYDLTILKKDTNEKTYLGTYDTVMPGETSPTFETSGPNTQKDEDYEILKLDLVAKLDNGNELHIEYDFKLGTAEWAEYE